MTDTSLDNHSAQVFLHENLSCNGINVDSVSISDSHLILVLPYDHFITFGQLVCICSVFEVFGLPVLYIKSGGVWFRISRESINQFLGGELEIDAFVERWEWVDVSTIGN